jgi:hypothetical protein
VPGVFAKELMQAFGALLDARWMGAMAAGAS